MFTVQALQRHAPAQQRMARLQQQDGAERFVLCGAVRNVKTDFHMRSLCFFRGGVILYKEGKECRQQ